jgi:diguanylate cyclase (GGDEF)-like protein/PAS domain S-box-containing protein
MTIRVRLLALVMAVLLPFAVISAVYLLQEAREAKDKAFATVHQTALIQRDAVAQFLNAHANALAAIAARPMMAAMQTRPCDPFLRAYIDFHSEYAGLQVLDLQGKSLCTYQPVRKKTAPVQPGKTPWFDRGLAANSFSVSDAHRGPNEGDWEIVLTYPINDRTGLRVGLLALPMDLLELNIAMMPASEGDEVVSISDARGTFLMRSVDPLEWIGQLDPVVIRAPRQKDKSSKGLFTAMGPKGIMRMNAVLPIEGVDWQVVVGVPEASAMAASRDVRNHSGWILSTLALLGLTLAWRLGSGILKPIKALTRTASAVASGDGTARAHVSGPPELAAVAVQFNRMLDLRDAVEDTVREGQARYRSLVEWSPVGICVYAKGKLLYANPAAVTMMGAQTASQLIGRTMMDLVHPDHRQMAFHRAHQALMAGSPIERAQEKLLTLDGRTIDVDIQGSLIQYQGETAIQINVQDVTQQLQSDKRLQLLATVFSHAREGIVITNAQGEIVEVNDTFTEITGYTREDAVGQKPHNLLASSRNSESFYAQRAAALESKGYWIGEVWSRRKNGEVFAEILTISAVKDADGTVQNYVALFTDITQQKEHQRQLEHIAHYDTLTGLPNRVLLADRLQTAMANCQRQAASLAVAFLDLDGFKSVNDRYGHRTGDEFLVVLSQRMKEALRDEDTLSRIGGDEFVVVMSNLHGPQDYEPVLQRLLQAAANPVVIGHLSLQVSTSIGVTLYPQDGSDADVLLRHADQAMYVAKQSGKDRFHLFDVAKDTAVKTERETLEHMEKALENDEFVLYYQPKVNLTTGVVVGAEALIRWRHPERGLLQPAEFLPIIENQPVSLKLGEWVLTTALAQAAQWAAQGLPMPVSVNISAIQMQDAGFVRFVRASLARHPQLAAGCLELEILETTALEDMAKVSQTMRACQQMGVRFTLDDFGTGYSSLTYLKRLPAESLKIDRSFVHNMLSDRDDLAIVQGVIGLANTFKREVVAEGVETQAHGAMLLSLGCPLVQGDGLARPMPGTAFPAWAQAWHEKPCWTA